MSVTNIIYLSQLGGTTGKRIDAEYYDPLSVESECLLKRNLSKTIRSSGISVDASAFYPSIAEYYQGSGIPSRKLRPQRRNHNPPLGRPLVGAARPDGSGATVPRRTKNPR